MFRIRKEPCLKNAKDEFRREKDDEHEAISRKPRRSNKSTGGSLYGDVLANILSSLPRNEVITCGVVRPKWRDADHSMPVQELVVDTRDITRVLPSLAAAIPCLQKLKFDSGPPDDKLHVDYEIF